MGGLPDPAKKKEEGCDLAQDKHKETSAGQGVEEADNGSRNNGKKGQGGKRTQQAGQQADLLGFAGGLGVEETADERVAAAHGQEALLPDATVAVLFQESARVIRHLARVVRNGEASLAELGFG